MKKRLFILVFAIVASCLSLGAQSLKDNPDYKLSLEYKAKAASAYDKGDYDLAADYAAKAKEHAALSDAYVEKMLAKYKASRAIAQAKAQIAWADGIDAKTNYPDLYSAASDLYSSALSSFDAEKYAESADQARSTVAAVTAIAIADAKAAIAQATDRKAEADSFNAKELYPDQYDAAMKPYTASLGYLDAESYLQSAPKAREAAKAFAAIVKADAEAFIARAKDAVSSAEAIEAPANFPDEYAQATTALADAQGAYDAEDYLTAGKRARDCIDALANVKAIAKPVEPVVAPPEPVIEEKVEPSWPAIYIVRLIPARRDCLWRIAEYPFIYNNPLKWPVIYEANKKTFRNPGNPNLIFPGQKLVIPSIRGEKREGTYDPKASYEVFPKK